ncbi:MAG: bifunctional sugar-1-phosphate nucleotidylyltransferase/acetyltransferase [Chloroflexota bacterium]
MKAIILAAGEGSRMRPLTCIRPKVMLPVAGKPIIEHLVLQAIKAGVKEFIFVVGYHDEAIRGYFKSGEKWGINIDYLTQYRQLGTADALKAVRDAKANFLMMNGDAVIHYDDIRSLSRKRTNTMTLYEVVDASGLGVVTVQGNKVTRIYEKVAKPPSHLANAGLYLFTPDILEAINKTSPSPRGEYELTDSIQIMIDEGTPVTYRKASYWLDLSYPWDLLTANEALLNELKPEKLGKIEAGVSIIEPVAIGKGTQIRSGTYIIGPVVIGEDCEIGPNCYIRPATSIGNSCHIGASCEVKNSIIMAKTNVPHLNYVGDSVIGENVNLGAGTKLANLRLDEAEIRVGGLATKRRKLGAIIGDGVKTGINASIDCGSVIGNGTFIGPGAVVSGVIAPNSMIL